MIEQDRRRVRAQLDKFVFTQSLIGAPQDGIVRLFLRVAVLLSFVVGPVLLLLGFQLRFLPYHSVGVTYVHRVALLADLALLALLWPKISKSGAQSAQGLPERRGTPWRLVAAGFSGVAVLAFSLLLATVPGEQIELGRSTSDHPYVRALAAYRRQSRPFLYRLSLLDLIPSQSLLL